jgi:hypothetical protein
VQATPEPEGSKSRALLGVSCASAGSCSAVGRYVISSASGELILKEEGTLALSWGGGEWQLQPAPGPEGLKLPRLVHVSCSAAAACTAVGWAKKEKSAAETRTLAERYE